MWQGYYRAPCQNTSGHIQRGVAHLQEHAAVRKRCVGQNLWPAGNNAVRRLSVRERQPAQLEEETRCDILLVWRV